jgi:hypothetical protein
VTEPLKVGDLCDIVAAPCMPPEGAVLVGLDCTIIDIDPPHPDPLIRLLLSLRKEPFYAVQTNTGLRLVLCVHMLRKKKPPAERSTWEAVAKATGWNPIAPKVPA